MKRSPLSSSSLPNSIRMYQAQVNGAGEAPKYTSVAMPAVPGPEDVRIKVQATGVHRLVRSRASGQHYSADHFPIVPGVDGVGSLDNGQLVYWMSLDVGAMAEYINIPKRNIRALPEGADPVQVSALVNPAMSSFMAIKARTTDLPKDFTTLIVGATSASGRVAAAAARYLGAGTVIGAARNKEALQSLGLDETVLLKEQPTETDWTALGDVDLILDYCYGPVAVHLLQSLRSARPVQYVHIGGLSGTDISLPGSVLRSKDLTIRGSGAGAWRLKDVAKVLDEILDLVKGLPKEVIRTAKLEDVEDAWMAEGGDRLVIVM